MFPPHNAPSRAHAPVVDVELSAGLVADTGRWRSPGLWEGGSENGWSVDCGVMAWAQW